MPISSVAIPAYGQATGRLLPFSTLATPSLGLTVPACLSRIVTLSDVGFVWYVDIKLCCGPRQVGPLGFFSQEIKDGNNSLSANFK